MERKSIIRLAFLLLPFSFLLLAGGCRREDVREMTVFLPGLREADKAKIVEALAPRQRRRRRILSARISGRRGCRSWRERRL